MFFTLYTPRFPPIFLEQDPRRRKRTRRQEGRVGSDIDTNVVGQMARQGDQTYYVRNNTIGVRQRSYMHSRPRGLRSDVSEARQPDPSDTETREARHPRGRRAVMLLTYPACLCKKQKSYVYLFRYKTYIYFSYSIEKHAFIV